MLSKNVKLDLHEAAFSGNVGLLRLLLDQGEDPDGRSLHGQTALHRASMNGNLDCARILISYGAQTHMQDQAGCTPLHYAAGNGHLVLVKWFIHEVDVNLTPKSNKERTPRMLAKRNGHSKVAHFLAEMENKQSGFSWLGSP
ncbi:ankyrin repeat, PH and SEC7 domain containing protein secG-like [Acanthaster planci]|uniref:Ankyrin repeat, PH and SEC7 domain containing protein secG-like n=1 Tax=Acanthaster planci TaxID=133434 RepID=A0A8B7YQA5_ACAPL|nr:ankyrin repeat, PH and SEC7 domain containing protein secG-like [Acanthaster planci]